MPEDGACRAPTSSWPGTPGASRDQTELPLTAAELARLRGLGEPIDLDEVGRSTCRCPGCSTCTSRARPALHAATATFLGDRPGPDAVRHRGRRQRRGRQVHHRPPAARLLARWPDHPTVELVTTDGFLLPNAELARRGLLDRKGFPESYDRQGAAALRRVEWPRRRRGRRPVYSHLTSTTWCRASTWWSAGPTSFSSRGSTCCNRPARATTAASRSERLLRLLDLRGRGGGRRPAVVRRPIPALARTAFPDPASYFHRFAELDRDAAVSRAERLWGAINGPNLVQNILPTRGRATLVLHKVRDHSVRQIRLRKL